ncbi:MAG TPA: TIGR03084 family metal-binding protein [Candidatus Dormibacteraeota bacterium]|nr:TIGR03084 family metal-binding protein [Candidatus Dormibacteraeota bacterium]
MSRPDLPGILADLDAEHAALDGIVAPLSPARWDTATPAEPWTVRDQVAHLAFFDREAVRAMTDPEGFVAGLAEIVADPDGWMAATLEPARTLSTEDLLADWRAGRDALIAAATTLDPAARVPWYGPPMGMLSFLSARLMETWIHGQDVADALHAERVPTARLRHIAHIAVRARPFNYAQHGRELPPTEVRVELRAPDASTWTWGPETTPDTVTGDALDFCLVTTQRRHIADTDLRVEGDRAQEWMGIAQAFAGPPGPGRQKGQYPKRIDKS